MAIDLKLRATQVWGYLTLILGCLLSVVQFFALISPRRLDLRVFFLLVFLAGYLIFIGKRSVGIARRSEAPGRRTLADDLRAAWAQCEQYGERIALQLRQPSATRTVFVSVLGLVHMILGFGAFLFVGTVILAMGHYLGLGPAGLPVLFFCGLGIVFGIAMVVRPNGEAYRAAMVWDAVLGGFFLLSAAGRLEFFLERIMIAVLFMAMGGATLLLRPIPARRPDQGTPR